MTANTTPAAAPKGRGAPRHASYPPAPSGSYDRIRDAHPYEFDNP